MFRRCACLAVLALFAMAAHATETTATPANNSDNKPKAEAPRYGALRFVAVNLRKGPGKRYPIDWVYRRPGMPVEVIKSFDTWYRIRDYEGAEGWVHKTQVKFQRRGMITGKIRPLFESPDDKSAVQAYLQPLVLFDLTGCSAEWCAVRGDGFSGYLRKTGFFGAYAKEVFE